MIDNEKLQELLCYTYNFKGEKFFLRNYDSPAD
jgi:hypothetical protein